MSKQEIINLINSIIEEKLSSIDMGEIERLDISIIPRKGWKDYKKQLEKNFIYRETKYEFMRFILEETYKRGYSTRALERLGYNVYVIHKRNLGIRLLTALKIGKLLGVSGIKIYFLYLYQRIIEQCK